MFLGQKAVGGLGHMGLKEVCVLPTQSLGQRAVENVVRLILDAIRGAHQACAHVAGGLQGLRQVSFPLNA